MWYLSVSCPDSCRVVAVVSYFPRLLCLPKSIFSSTAAPTLGCDQHSVEKPVEKVGEHAMSVHNDMYNIPAESSISSKSATDGTTSTQLRYDRCIDQSTSVARMNVNSRSSPTGATGDFSSIVLNGFDFGRWVQCDKTDLPHQQLKQRS
jgi:hypothetical protein